MMSYATDWTHSKDLEEIEQQMCYDESFSYNAKRDISIKNWEYNDFLFFRWFKIYYVKGNVCATEYLLEESYIHNFLDNAEILINEDDIDLETLIEGKTAIVANKRYPWNDENHYIEYKLDGLYKEMFIYINDKGLLIIQVGLSDEGAKYIAYK